MQPIKAMYRQFLSEPIWFKVMILSALLLSIVFSSSYFSDHGYYQSLSKIAAAIFFGSYGIKMRRNKKVSGAFFIIAVICIYLAWSSLSLADL
ncbi:hypothetical protein [Paenibacillus sp. PL91]|uniref:hypothetical protein n=1 Tax=Paenibacillus sp. PL91 TaxID=2729538 RepID=UPI00145F8255|nr:hypothetical protein [Paenibacillus sp. PL91]MBC9202181.1 hypothetical protein [Paenibacillus sp. PL91]